MILTWPIFVPKPDPLKHTLEWIVHNRHILPKVSRVTGLFCMPFYQQRRTKELDLLKLETANDIKKLYLFIL